MLFSLCVLFFVFPSATGDIVLKPTNFAKTEVGIVFLPGEGFAAEEYRAPFTTVQSECAKKSIRCWVGLLAESSSIDGAVKRVTESMISQGMSSDTSLFHSSHSVQQGFKMAAYAINQTQAQSRGVILLGGILNRFSNNARTPVLSVNCELDGLVRITRVAEAAYKQQDTKNQVIVIPGCNHVSFADGAPIDSVTNRDFRSETTASSTQDLVAAFIASFVARISSNDAKAAQYLEQKRDHTLQFFQPLFDAMKLSGNHRYREQCNSDYPTNPSCDYPKWPNQSLPPGPHGPPSPMPAANCICGSNWVEQHAQRVMSGFSESEMPDASSMTKDAFHDVSDVHPFHLPHIFNSCTKGSAGCTLNTTTVTMPVYQDDVDNGMNAVGAYEYRTKMKSRQAMWQAAGMDASDINKLDGNLTLCRDTNQLAWDYALKHAPSQSLSRFESHGEPLIMTNDVVSGIGITGPKWIADMMVYKRVSKTSSSGIPTAVQIQSWTFKTKNYNRGNVPYIVTAGYHYCKLLTPLRAMEWILYDSLREYYSLGNQTQVRKMLRHGLKIKI